MANETTFQELLQAFSTATDSALSGLPAPESILPPADANSLLTVKNEIFLSYLQALALRNLSVIRSFKDGSNAEAMQTLSDAATRRLMEQRVYLERGVRPLEQKIKYQVDLAVKAAEDAERTATQKANNAAITNGRGKSNGTADTDSDDDDSEDDDEDDEAEDNLNYRANPAAMKSATSHAEDTRAAKGEKDGVYRPPRISATAMPLTDRKKTSERKNDRSRTVDEYISTEMSTAPLAEPSIGSNITTGGRNNKSARQLRDEAERQNYEETNLVRLPALSKKEQARKGYGRENDGGFGGEDWRDLGRSVDRIGDLTRKKGKDTMVDKSRKRRATEDGPRGDGGGAGGLFDQKKRRMMKKGQM